MTAPTQVATCTKCGFTEDPDRPPREQRRFIPVVDEIGSSLVCDLCVYPIIVDAVYAGWVPTLLLSRPAVADAGLPRVVQ